MRHVVHDLIRRSLAGPAALAVLAGGLVPSASTSSPELPASPVRPAVAVHAALDGPVGVVGQRLVDSAGRTVTLRGVVTLADDVPRYDYTVTAYQRIASLGANLQVIRIGEAILSGRQGSRAAGAYLARLRQMVANAHRADLATVLKMAFNDDPAYHGTTAATTWTLLWNGHGPERPRLATAWERVWRCFRGNASVLGYDLINEPQQGGYAGMPASRFEATYLTPAYQRLIDALRATDPHKVPLFQGTFDPATQTITPYAGLLHRPGAVYTAHYYPNLEAWVYNGDASTAAYRPLLARFQAAARANHAPLFIGEYDMPFAAARDGDPARVTAYTNLSRAAATLIDAAGLSAVRAWYSDDREATWDYDWAIIQGSGGLAGPERTVDTNVFARPHPIATGGRQLSFRYDFGTGTFTQTWRSDSNNSTATILVPVRHYPDGFAVTVNRRLTMTVPPGRSLVALRALPRGELTATIVPRALDAP